MYHRRTSEAAKGQWRGILQTLGVPQSALKNRHGPCPMCGGKDRFRFDNAEGKGTWICGQCGAGDGMALAIAFTGKEYRDVANQIDGILGNTKFCPDEPKPEITEEQRRDALREVWKASQPIEQGDLADLYFRSRGIGELSYPSATRFAPRLRDGEGGVRPALVSLVGRYGEARFDSIHRTFLAPDGKGKADMRSPRKMMPGKIPDGACVMLSEYSAGGTLGIAEGIETAMSASALYDVPVWAAINSAMLAKWIPPDGCDDVAIFADHDAKFGGQSAAYALAHRLAVKGISVTVTVPDLVGTDFNDILRGKV